MKRNLAGQNGADQPGNLLSAASQTASQPVNNGSDALQAKLASVMLDMLRLDAGVAAQGSRLTLSALRALVDGQRSIPGRKSVIYFTTGMYLTPELDAPFPQSDGDGEPEQHHVLFGGYARRDDDVAERGSHRARWPAPPAPARPP